MTVQLAITTSGVMKVVSRISGIAMPSTPSEYDECSDGIQSRCSVNCINGVEVSKYTHRSVEMPNVAAVVSRATQRPSAAPRSPRASMITPPKTGNQMSTLSIGQSNCIVRFLLPQHVPREQRRQSDDHRERVVIEEARLHVAQYSREPADHARRPVHHSTVDQRDIAGTP